MTAKTKPASTPLKRPSRSTAKSAATPERQAPRHYAVVGAGIAGIACARTLVQAGHRVTVFEKSRGPGGRMATRHSEFGGFDHGTQYFTVRDARFEKALASASGLVRPWSANTVRILDEAGRVVASALPPKEAHWVATPGMNALVKQWALPLGVAGALALETEVIRMEADKLHPDRWQMQTEGPGAASQVYSGFDAVVLAVPAPQAHALLLSSQQGKTLMPALSGINIAPCWTLMLAFPQALQPTLPHLGPHWNAARSTHHRITWLARESSKPGRGAIERWTVQASPEWSQKHLEDDAERVKAKLLKAFTEVTGIRAQPSHAVVHRWRYAQTTEPLGQPFLWDAKSRIGSCGDWCIGHRVEDGFVSGLEMALALV
ncbi:MAG TPA: FAD-dependent oxidoreductase [Polaromonas sp.]|uniref:NAD(P)/FAD-dependent oxidoreductase n=1 Tax=Polaromonas sp. TaxID=1869339 RepID=UPI002D61235E|nr:FAD-dependent oxidoreductase [Polaromonas sp.]HYW55679.1 FAD-dependent oxidoreductase [Polaromonas sp.]